MSFSSFSSFASSHSAGKKSSAFGDLITSGLIVYYDSSNSSSYSGSGSSITDLSSEGNDGTISGSPTFSSDRFTLDGINDYITIPDLSSSITAVSESHTLEVWVDITGRGVVAQYSGNVSPETGYYHSAIEADNKDELKFGLWNGTGITSIDTPDDIVPTSGFDQFVLVYNGSTLSCYRNGSFISSTSVTWDSPMDGSPALPFYIHIGAQSGTNMGDGSYLDGDFGIVRVYDRALSSDEIASNYSFNQNTF